MNNTTTTALAAIVVILMSATLVVGATTITSSTAAFAYKKGDGHKGNENGNTITIQKNKQDPTQSGFDSSFEQEAQNLICTHPGENATCSSEGAQSVGNITPGKNCVTVTISGLVHQIRDVTVCLVFGQPTLVDIPDFGTIKVVLTQIGGICPAGTLRAQSDSGPVCLSRLA